MQGGSTVAEQRPQTVHNALPAHAHTFILQDARRPTKLRRFVNRKNSKTRAVHSNNGEGVCQLTGGAMEHETRDQLQFEEGGGGGLKESS